MPTFHITSPDGHTYEVTAPEGATEQEALAHIQQTVASQQKPTAPKAEPKTSQSLGFYEGVVKPFDNAAVALEAGAKKIGIPTDKINSFLGTPSSVQAKQSHADYIRQAAQGGVVPGGVGKFAGEVAGTLPLAAVTTNPIALGALTGAALTDSDTPEGAATDAGLGAVGGKVGDTAIRGLSRVISPRVSPYVQQLLGEGARLTPGQIIGGGFKRAEDALKSVPLLGDMIGNAQNSSIKSINNISANRALAPIGKAVTRSSGAGHGLTQHVSDELGNAYDNLLPNLSGSQDQQFITDLGAAGLNLQPSQAAQLQRIVQAQIQGKMPAGGSLTGRDLKGVDEELRRLSQGYSTDPSFDTRELGNAVGDVRDAFRRMLTRQNPTYADKLSDINKGYANYARIRQAGSSVGAKEGVYTPAQLNNAVKATDKSAGKGKFAKGEALMQDLSTAADQVVSSKVNDSGTATRLATGAILAGGGAYLHPASLVATLGAMGAYTKPGLAALEVALTKRPQAAKALSDLIRKGDKAGALAAANALVGSQAASASP